MKADLYVLVEEFYIEDYESEYESRVVDASPKLEYIEKLKEIHPGYTTIKKYIEYTNLSQPISLAEHTKEVHELKQEIELLQKQLVLKDGHILRERKRRNIL